MQESWVELEEFPGYAVSDHGRVLNTYTDLVKSPSCNQAGIPMVNLIRDKKQNVRSVALLVANTFLDPPQSAHFDTPINLNGNRTDNRAENLAWRPRWFAIKYHRQFKERDTQFGFREPVEIIQTGEQFPTSWEAAIKYGLLDFEIFLATMNRTYVFPTGHQFRVLDI